MSSNYVRSFEKHSDSFERQAEVVLAKESHNLSQTQNISRLDQRCKSIVPLSECSSKPRSSIEIARQSYSHHTSCIHLEKENVKPPPESLAASLLKPSNTSSVSNINHLPSPCFPASTVHQTSTDPIELAGSKTAQRIEKLLAVFEAASQDLRQNSRYLLHGCTLSFFQN